MYGHFVSTVTLKSTTAATFKGFLVQARSGNSKTALGTFDVSQGTNAGKTLNCPKGTAVCYWNENLLRNI
jgi:hypothetical protein